MTHLVSFRDATLGYATTPALSGLTLDVDEGQALALVGPNGGGKTTLMRGIAGGCTLLSGSVEVNAKRIGLVPQSADLDLTFPVNASEVVTMGLIAEAGWGRRITADMRRRVDEALERVNLIDRASHRFGTLSGGQRQRVLVARALVARPQLVMMDEPFNGLDAPSRDIITRLITELTAGGVGIVVSTHDLSLARDVCSDACILASHQIALGPVADTLVPSHLARAYGSGADEAIAALS
ncbi:ABC transporter ATP-binding protein [Schaalia meyeri]|uniref:Metal ABC transporter ATP-binding protein n=1 Tax=Schaalia meyeri TaxID=52773 RepID=A0AAQ0BWI0_9ACTO|nr:metal ABC transporter ATP-binding protein [Schaalia meyeri]AKU65330.1 ABC transporter ATP-binding protein [Schaalia meyeri]OFQ23051.1 ABC transporter ATP-binding protein [Actinomyces sp. HMSC062G12]QQC43976.1 metal ABC transporter ATP-binding protein [Schaalia meyeri]SDR65893.1 ABC-type Mn2+/Zn2+ transport system, ATPase component [Schaalia meyeri]